MNTQNKISLSTIVTLVTIFSFFPSIAQAKNIPVPFTSQAPYSIWSQPWQDFCEEASILMVDYYYKNKPLDKIVARQELLNISKIKENYFGWSLDENAEKINQLVNNFLSWETKIVENPELDEIKMEIDASRPVILPVHGKFLYNPYFRYGGPDYHTIVISGYDDTTQEFITQEPGTRHGFNFRYKYDTLLNAMHDFLPGNTRVGKKLALFTDKNLNISKDIDADKDGLSKEDELKLGTILCLEDSDGDGYKDGQEVKTGYSPTISESNLPNKSLIKSPSDPKVYLLENKIKRHIINEEVFLRHGWQWHNIKFVSDRFLENLKIGEKINN